MLLVCLYQKEMHVVDMYGRNQNQYLLTITFNSFWVPNFPGVADKVRNSPVRNQRKMSEEGKMLRIAMFPWLAFGHMIPFLELAKPIAERGHQISFISTPRNIHRLPKIPPHLSPNFTFVSLPLIQVDNLPPDAEATSDLPLHLVPYLKIAYDGLQSSLSEYLEVHSPDWLVYDFAPHWLPPIAANLGIFCAFFSIFPAWTLTFFGSYRTMIGEDHHEPLTKPEQLTVPPKWITFPSKVAFKIHEAKRMCKQIDLNESGVTDLFRFSCVIKGCEVLAPRSCVELESDYLTLLSNLNNKVVLPVGLLPPSKVDQDDRDDAWIMIRQFLDTQDKGTTLFIAFGSELELRQEDVLELAFGLELSSLPFIWAFRKSQGSNSLELPQGFEERVKGRGLVWTSWVPQHKIMAHESVGGFVTHCGGSSVIEATYFGLPMIMMPFSIDTGLNARVFEDKKVGIEVPRDEEDGSFTRESVAESMRLVVVEKEGEIYRENAKKMKTLYADKELNDGYIDRFVEFLQNHKH